MKNKLLEVILLAFFISFLVNLTNLLTINLFDKNGPIFSSIEIALYTFPLELILTIFFNYYYSTKVKEFSYIFLSILYIIINILLSIFIQYIIFDKTISIINLIGVIIILIGIYILNIVKREKK